MAHYKWIARVLLCLLGPAWASDTQALVPSDAPRFTVGESVDEFDVLEDGTSGYYYEAVADRGDHVGAIDNSQGKKRRVFVGVSIESGGAYVNPDWEGAFFDFRTGRYVEVGEEPSYSPISGWSVQVGRDPLAIEAGWEQVFYFTSEQTVSDSFFLNLKCNVGRLKQFPIWAVIGIGRSNLMDPDRLGFLLKTSFGVKRWTKSELSVDMGYRHMISTRVFSPGGSGVSIDYKIISATIKWTYFIYESPIRSRLKTLHVSSI